MKKETMLAYLDDLRHLTLHRKRYKTPQGKSRQYWENVQMRYSNMEKSILSSDYHWRIIHYNDGRKELAYLRVLQGGFFSGLYPAIYRGLIIPHRIGFGTYAHIKRITLAF